MTSIHFWYSAALVIPQVPRYKDTLKEIQANDIVNLVANWVGGDRSEIPNDFEFRDCTHDLAHNVQMTIFGLQEKFTGCGDRGLDLRIKEYDLEIHGDVVGFVAKFSTKPKQ